MGGEGNIDLESTLEAQGIRLGRVLGSGSYGNIRIADCMEQENNVRHLAIKIVDRDKAPQDFVLKFFPRELEVLRKLNHPNIIHVYKIIEVGSRVCILMEWAQGGDVLEHIIQNGALPLDLSRRMLSEVVSALEYLHDMHIAHRDLKCENILLNRDLHVRLGDFGFARMCINPTTKKRVLSDTYCGSAAYASPEILLGKPYNPKMSDLWSLGVVLYIMVTGLMPFDDSDKPKMLKIQLERKWSFPSNVRASLPNTLQTLVRNLLEPDVTRRANMNVIKSSSWLRNE